MQIWELPWHWNSYSFQSFKVMRKKIPRCSFKHGRCNHCPSFWLRSSEDMDDMILTSKTQRHHQEICLKSTSPFLNIRVSVMIICIRNKITSNKTWSVILIKCHCVDELGGWPQKLAPSLVNDTNQGFCLMSLHESRSFYWMMPSSSSACWTTSTCPPKTSCLPPFSRTLCCQFSFLPPTFNPCNSIVLFLFRLFSVWWVLLCRPGRAQALLSLPTKG